MTEITQDDLVSQLTYNPTTGEFHWVVSKGNRKSGSIAGSIGYQGYRSIHINHHSYQAHRLAWLITYRAFPFGEIDHINGNKADNRIENLRDVTRSLNKQNTKKAYSGNSSGLLGASWCNTQRKYLSQICINGKVKHLGYYEVPELAHQAYLTAKRSLHAGGTI